MKVEIEEMKNEYIIEKINKAPNYFLEKSNKIDKNVPSLILKKVRRHKTNIKIKIKKRDS